jgi:hypothetical protein
MTLLPKNGTGEPTTHWKHASQISIALVFSELMAGGRPKAEVDIAGVARPLHEVSSHAVVHRSTVANK